MREEKVLFEKALQRTALYWKFTGIQINYDNPFKSRSYLHYIRTRWFYIFNFLWLNLGITSVCVSMFVLLSLQEILYMIPCIVICLLGDVKSYYFLKHESKVFDIINTLRKLQSIDDSEGKEEVLNEFVKKNLPFTNKGNILLLFNIQLGVTTFCVGPLVITALHYYSTNEIKYFLPYMIWYPFDDKKLGGWFVAWIHQFWSAWLATFYVYGTDRYFYTICAFLHNQVLSLKYDLARIGPKSFMKNNPTDPQNIEVLIYRHRELIRCVDMLNVIFGKSTLFNVVSSSFIICLGGVNVKLIENIIVMVPFAATLFFGSIQVWLFCYYGDMLMRASLELSDAIFHSPNWYNMDASSMKCCLFILMRTQKPCRITALGFRVINLMTFSKILSTAWSYFTLLNTMYSRID